MGAGVSVPDPELEPDCAGSFLLLQASNAKRVNAITDNFFMVITNLGAKVHKISDICKRKMKISRAAPARHPLNSRTPKVNTNGRNGRKDEWTKDKGEGLGVSG